MKLAAPAMVAPIFVHGNGRAPARGALGCIAVAAPVFLSEDEALDVIVDTLAAYGLQLSERRRVLEKVIIDGREIDYGSDWLSRQYDRRCRAVRGPLEADLSDAEGRVSVEYVARDDFDRLGGNDDEGWSMDLKQVAEHVAARVTADGESVHFGAFYDPVEYYDFRNFRDESSGEERPHSPGEAKARATRLLREQVQDFARWLEAQGVI